MSEMSHTNSVLPEEEQGTENNNNQNNDVVNPNPLENSPEGNVEKYTPEFKPIQTETTSNLNKLKNTMKSRVNLRNFTPVAGKIKTTGIFTNLRKRFQRKGDDAIITQGYQLFEKDSSFVKETHRIIDELSLQNERMFEKTNLESKEIMHMLEMNEAKMRDNLALLMREMGEVCTTTENIVKHKEWHFFQNR